MTCNNVTNADQLRGIGIPDKVPSQLVPPGMLSMCAGDFAVSSLSTVQQRLADGTSETKSGLSVCQAATPDIIESVGHDG
jgi:hypothetical protein